MKKTTIIFAILALLIIIGFMAKKELYGQDSIHTWIDTTIIITEHITYDTTVTIDTLRYIFYSSSSCDSLIIYEPPTEDWTLDLNQLFHNYVMDTVGSSIIRRSLNLRPMIDLMYFNLGLLHRAEPTLHDTINYTIKDSTYIPKSLRKYFKRK